MSGQITGCNIDISVSDAIELIILCQSATISCINTFYFIQHMCLSLSQSWGFSTTLAVVGIVK